MSLTFSVLGTLALILPALAAILFWNLRSKRFLSARPDVPITAMSVLTLVTFLTIAINLLTWSFFLAFQGFAENLQPSLPCETFPDVCRPLLNPVELLAGLIQHGSDAPPTPPEYLLYIGIMIMLQTIFAMSMVMNEGIDLLLADIDLIQLGWTHTYIWLPSKNGYFPIASVITSIQHNGMGVGYRGLISDIRTNEHGETLNISLSAPHRFLYEIRSDAAPGWGRKKLPPAFIKHEGEDGPAAVSLSSKVILNVEIENTESGLLELDLD